MGRIWLQRDTAKWNYYAHCLQGRFCFTDQHAIRHSNDGTQGAGTGESVLSWRDISGFLVSGKVHNILCRFTFITAIRIHKLWFRTGLEMLFSMMTPSSHHTADHSQVSANMVIGYLCLYGLEDSLTATICLIIFSLLGKGMHIKNAYVLKSCKDIPYAYS